MDYVRSLPPAPDSRATYTINVDGTKQQPAREARVVMALAKVTVPPPAQAPPEIAGHGRIGAHVLRVWEPGPPEGVKRVEWILPSSLPITAVDETLLMIDWCTCRWLCEDYHQCLKTGCRAEETQTLDEFWGTVAALGSTRDAGPMARLATGPSGKASASCQT